MPSFEEYTDEIRSIWDTKWLSNRGALSKEFEKKLEDYLQVDHAYCFANGHLALEIAINALFLKGEVITTPFTHVSTTHAIVRNGLKPVFVDVREGDYTIDPVKIEEAITDKTCAIVATHIYGFPCDVEEIDRIAKKHHLYVIYDAAHAFGVKYKGIGIGNFGDAAMFSTHATKVFQTIEGGVVTYKDAGLMNPIRNLVNFGYVDQENIKYVGTNGRMNEFEAAMGICNLRHIDEDIALRRKAAERYWERLDGIRGIHPLKPGKDVAWNYAYFPVIFDGYKLDRNQVQAGLMEEGIYARKYFYPLTNHADCYKEEYGNVPTPVADHVAETVLTLPMYSDLTRDDVDRICDAILQ